MQQSAGRLLGQIENALEVRQLAIVGIGNFAQAQLRRVVEQQLHAMTLPGWGERQRRFLILQVHHQDAVEAIEVLHLQHARTLRRHVDAARAGHPLRALVGRTADVIAVGAGRIGFHRQIGPGGLRQ